MVLDARLDGGKAVDLRGEAARDGRPLPVAARLQHRRRRALRLDGNGQGQVPRQPLPALGQRLGVGVDPADPLPGRLRQQAVGDPQADLPADRKGRRDEPRQGGPHGPLHGVFQGDDAEVAPLFLNGVEDAADRHLRREPRASSEALEGRQVGEGPLRPQAGHRQGRLEGARRGEDLAPDAPQRLRGKRPFVQGCDLVEDPALLHRVEHGKPGFGLHPAHLDGKPGALAEEPDQFPVLVPDPAPDAFHVRSFHDRIASIVSRTTSSGTPPLTKGMPGFLSRTK